MFLNTRCVNKVYTKFSKNERKKPISVYLLFAFEVKACETISRLFKQETTMLTFSLIMAGLIFGVEPLTIGEMEEVADGYVFTEGPLWLSDEEKWIFSDVRADTIYDSNGERHLRPSKGINGMALDMDGRVVACQSDTHSIVRFERNGEVSVLASAFEGKALNSTNDLVVRSDGVIFFTDPKRMQRGFESALGYAGVFALWPETGDLKCIVDTLKYPNGIGLSPDEKTLYVADTSGAGIFAYALSADGTVSGGRKFCKATIPDGLAVDADGNLWVAYSQGIATFSSQGEILQSIKTNAMPTNCSFGGVENKTLLVTARKKVFRIQTVVKGR